MLQRRLPPSHWNILAAPSIMASAVITLLLYREHKDRFLLLICESTRHCWILANHHLTLLAHRLKLSDIASQFFRLHLFYFFRFDLLMPQGKDRSSSALCLMDFPGVP